MIILPKVAVVFCWGNLFSAKSQVPEKFPAKDFTGYFKQLASRPIGEFIHPAHLSFETAPIFSNLSPKTNL